MADPITIPDDQSPENDAQEDIEMEGAADAMAGNGDTANAEGEDDAALPSMLGQPSRTAFLDYLKSPIVQIVVGNGDDRAVLSAHQDLLTKSPCFEQACAKFSDSSKRTIDLPDEDVDAVGSVLEYLYNGEYFPKRIGDGKDARLETDPSIPEIDTDGSQLLRHARIYTLADKFYMPQLKSIAHSKIHRTTSTARGEIEYARFVYASSSREDVAIRQPVAAFWATRSHVLRHDAEEEFRAMCLEFPQFGFDVLSRVLDQKEKKGGAGLSMAGAMGDVGVAVGATPGGSGKGRKRLRMSGA